MAALEQATKYPLEGVDADAAWVPSAFAFDAAGFACGQRQYALVLKVARMWASPRSVYNYFDDNIYAFRAAAELALAQYDVARADADKATKAASNACDQHFVYDPVRLPGGWSLFPPP